ncbi:putative aldehyde dehydrogenase-like protein [Scedosporium apiospermum]|uniref:Putative aldehyde dehydrogenase-like protein n=1 Tax=Pseudallescheria apiosperma TaxID=563466 RepID=A0A084G5E0_PSEDA|nr:putative aldehyde dehydrogenase-like protein [Scedosporium apiospermum]KEZ42552.1 putative aldehyde dehydrogenase-like protein [Scedosporium apiospermum]
MEVPLTAPNGKKWNQPVGLFINNETEGEICSVYSATPDDVHKAVTAARAALKDPSWKRLSGTDRGALLHKLADLVEQNAEVIATIETLDNGKPYTVSLESDIPQFTQVMRYYAGFSDKNFGQVIDAGPDKMAYTIKEPVGVCGQIIPWNYPLAMAGWKLGPALACGNTVVLKLSEVTPLSMLYVANLIRDAGFPSGVVNIINGYGREAGVALVEHPNVDKIAFTGSTATGKEIMRLASKTMKNITLETGGKSPLLVFEDANVAQAAKHAHLGIMSNSGQICTANSRLLVHEKVMDQFVDEFTKQVKNVSVIGDPFEKATFQGPQVSKEQYDRVLSYFKSGVDEGAKLVVGGRPAKVASGKGYFIEPTLFSNVKSSMKISREEIFGPCAVVIPFSTDEEAIEIANDTTYGLGAMVFTRDLVRAHKTAREIEAGVVFINSTDDSDVRAPFGGVKQSGIGRELGEAGLAAYCNIKSVHVNLTDE